MSSSALDTGRERESLQDRCSSPGGSRHGSPGLLFNTAVNGGGDKQVKRKVKRKSGGGTVWYRKKRVVVVIGLVGLFFIVNLYMLLSLQDRGGVKTQSSSNSSSNSSLVIAQVGCDLMPHFIQPIGLIVDCILYKL